MKKLVILIVIVGLVGGFVWYKRGLKPVEAGNTDRVIVKIEEGNGVAQISEELYYAGLIRSEPVFKWYVRLHGVSGSLKAGAFVLNKDMSVPEIVDVLVDGKVDEVSITIPEGYTVADIDALLAKMGLSASGAVIDCANRCDFATFDFLPDATNHAERGGKLEGYLFPDTYNANVADFVPKFFLERMLGNFRTKVVNGLAADIAASDRTLDDVVIMASLIEEETRTDAERAIVSGILWKRFDEGMGLGVDAAVRYILNKPTSALTVSDLNDNSAYNLRKFRGLPPGAIANPGLKSIQAALKPEASAYWYYLHGNDGQIRYAVTNDEHNLNKQLYLQ